MRARRHLQGQPECEATGIVLWIGGLLAAAGDPSQAGASGEELLQLAGRVGSNDLRALGLALCGHSRLVAGDITEGIALHDEAAAMAVGGELGPLVTGYVLCTIIYGCRARADWHRASELSTCANDWCDRTSMGYFPGLCRTHRAEVVRFSGRLEEARSEAWAAADLLLAASPFAGGLAFSELAEIAFRLGEFEEADQWCRRALAVGRPPQPVLGRLMLVQGAAESAVAGLRGCLEGLFLEDAVHVLPVLVEAALAAGDEVEAERALGELEVLASKLGTPAPRAALESSRGRVMLARGDAAAAQEVLRAAHQSWSRVGAPFEAADALLGLARAQALCSDRVGARVSAETARDEFRRIGAKAREREADDLVDGLTPGS
jgi:tetratricopeptide (TPR) repeat protein